MSNMNSRGVVLDRPFAEAFLIAAMEEGLIDNNPNIGDGFVRRLEAVPVKRECREYALEQLMLGGRVVMPFWMPTDWNGELFESGLIQTSNGILKNPDYEVNVGGIHHEMMIGMLDARGQHWTFEALDENYKYFLKLHEDWLAIADGKSFDMIDLKRHFAEIFGYEPEHYTEEQLAAWRKLQDMHKVLLPVINCFDDCNNVLGIALATGGLSSIKVIPCKAMSPLGAVNADEVNTKYAFLKIANAKLPRACIADTLKNTISIATSPEAEALREKLASWVHLLQNGNVEPAEIVTMEIARLRSSLKYSKCVSAIGNYTTWIGLASASATMLSSNPVWNELGITATVIGAVSLVGKSTLDKFTKWAMYSV